MGKEVGFFKGDLKHQGLCGSGQLEQATNLCVKGRPAGLLSSLVYDEQQVLGLAKLPAKPRKRHTGAAWGGAQGWRRDQGHWSRDTGVAAAVYSL